MASSILSCAVTASTFTDIAKLSQSASYDDILVLVLVILVSIAYLLRGIVWDKQDSCHHVWFERPQASGEGAKQAKKRTRNIAEKLEEAVSAPSHTSLVAYHGVITGRYTDLMATLIEQRYCHLLGFPVRYRRGFREPSCQGDPPPIRR